MAFCETRRRAVFLSSVGLIVVTEDIEGGIVND